MNGTIVNENGRWFVSVGHLRIDVDASLSGLLEIEGARLLSEYASISSSQQLERDARLERYDQILSVTSPDHFRSGPAMA